MRKAQVLIETIIGIGVIGIVLAGIIPFFTVSAKAEAESWKNEDAKMLGQETLESAKALKEDNWNNIYKPLGTTNKGASYPYHVDNNSGSWALASGSEDVSLNGMTFTRSLVIDNTSRTGTNAAGDLETSYNASRDDPSTQKITVNVTWPGSSGYQIIDYFTRNKNSLWSQTDWSGGSGQANWSDQTKYFSGTQIDGTTTAGSLKIAVQSSGTTNFGNEYIATSTAALYRLSSSTRRSSMRFTAQKTANVSSIRVYINARAGTATTYRYGIQANSSGNPSGTYLAYGDYNFTTTGWQTINFGSAASLTQNTIYHIVVQYASGTAPSSSIYVELRASAPVNHIIPFNDTSDPNSNTLYTANSGSTWTVNNQEPIYLLAYADSTYQANPFDTRTARNVYGVNFEGETFTITANKTATGAGLYMATSTTTSPADSLYVTLKDVTAGTTLINNEVFIAPYNSTTFAWKTHNFASSQSLTNGHQYQMFFSSPSSNSTNYYIISSDSDTPNAAPYNDLTWDGTNSFDIRSTNSGSSFTAANNMDISYYLLISGIQYYTYGELVSSTLDTGNPSGGGFNRVSWLTNSLPANTLVKMQLAANNDNTSWNFVGPAGTGSDWYLTALGENVWTGIQGNRYIRYKIRLETTDTTVTPSIDWGRVNWSY